MVDGSQRVEFEDVVVVRRTGLVVMCRVGPRVVGVPTRCMLPGTTISGTADRGPAETPSRWSTVLYGPRSAGGYVFVTSRYNWSTSAGFVR